jgi:plastocyanin
VKRRALALVLPALLVACGGGSSSSGPAVSTSGDAGAQTITVDMSDKLDFSPSSIGAKTGTVTFTVRNVGIVPHNLIFDDDLGKTGTVDGKTSQDLKVAFTKAGTYRFTCSFHPRMTGSVTAS